jgi:hypothetical protein
MTDVVAYFVLAVIAFAALLFMLLLWPRTSR